MFFCFHPFSFYKCGYLLLEQNYAEGSRKYTQWPLEGSNSTLLKFLKYKREEERWHKLYIDEKRLFYKLNFPWQLSFRYCGQLFCRIHVLPFMFEDLSGGESQVFITDVTVIISGKTGHWGGTCLSTFWLWKPQHIPTIRLVLLFYLFQTYRHQVSSQLLNVSPGAWVNTKIPLNKYQHKKFLTFLRLLLFSCWPAGGLVLHAFQWSQRHVEVTIRTAPESA